MHQRLAVSVLCLGHLQLLPPRRWGPAEEAAEWEDEQAAAAAAGQAAGRASKQAAAGAKKMPFPG